MLATILKHTRKKPPLFRSTTKKIIVTDEEIKGLVPLTLFFNTMQSVIVSTNTMTGEGGYQNEK